MKQLTIFAVGALLVGLVTVTQAASPFVLLLGKLVSGFAIVALGGVGVTYLMVKSFAGHTLRSEDFHWH